MSALETESETEMVYYRDCSDGSLGTVSDDRAERSEEEQRPEGPRRPHECQNVTAASPVSSWTDPRPGPGPIRVSVSDPNLE